MSKQDYSDKIVELLEGIVTRTNDINRNPHSEQCLELDLVMEDVRLLYRYYGMWKKACEAGHQQMAAAPVGPAREVPSFFTDAAEPEESPDNQADPLPEADPDPLSQADPDPLPEADPDPLSEAIPGPEPQPEPEPQPDPNHQPDPEPEPDIEPEPKSEPNPPPKKEEVMEPRSVKDKFSGEDNSVHQRIASQKEDKSIGARLQQHPIRHIKEAIGLNEKFLFINELFNGDIQAYNEAIANLNDMGDLTRAFDYLNKLTKDHGWDSGRSADTIEKLAGFVQRRYM